MTDIRKSLFTLFSGTLLTFGVWLAILMTVDPNDTDPLTILAFFSVFLWLTDCLLILLYIRSHVSKLTNQNTIPNSLLHSFLIIACILLLSILQTLRVLGWLEGVILIILLYCLNYI